MSERLIPVTSPSQLQPGMLVELRPCMNGCGRTQRFMLLAQDGWAHRWKGCEEPKWRILPTHACMEGMCPCTSIPDRRLFIVDTGLDAQAEQAQGKADATDWTKWDVWRDLRALEQSVSTDERNPPQ